MPCTSCLFSGETHTGQAFAATQWNDIETLDLRYSPLLATLRPDPRYAELQQSLDRYRW